MRFIISVMLAFIFTLNLSYAQTESLKDIIKTAVELSPQLKLNRTKIEIAGKKVAQNSNLPDPQVKLGLSNLPVNSFSFTQEPMTGKVVGLSQSFPFPGKLDAAEKLYKSDIGIAGDEFRKSENDLVDEIVTTFYQLKYKRAAVSTSNEILKLLESVYQIVERRYEVSEVSQQNLFLVKMQITNVQNSIELIKADEAVLQSKLNSYLFRQLDSPIATDENNYPVIKQINIAVLDSLAEIYNPSLAQINKLKDKAGLTKDLKEYEFYPNFNISAQYSQRDYLSSSNMDLKDFFSVFVGFNIPINYGGNKTAKIEEAELTGKLYSEQYELFKQKLKIQFGKSISVINGLKTREQLIAGKLIPEAEKSFETALADYQVNLIDFTNVINAQKDLYKTKLELEKIKSDYAIEFTKLENLVGTSLMNPGSGITGVENEK